MSKYKVEIVGLNTNNLKAFKNEKTIHLLGEYLKSKDRKIRNLIINGNLKLVLSVVNKFGKKVENLDDLFQIGVVGLIKAIDNFSLDHGVKFSTYAVPMIEGEIRRYLRDNSLLRVSRQVKDLSYKVLREKERIINEYSHIPSIEELSKNLNVEPKKIIEAIDVNIPISSINDPLSGDDEESLSLLDVYPDKNNSNEKVLLNISLKQGLEKLNKIERDIIYLRYFENKSQMQIAKMFNISQAQVSRLEKSAIEFLRKYV